MTWHIRQVRRRAAEQDQRTLLLMAAGAAGGPAAQKVWRMLAREVKDLAEGRESRVEGREGGTPLCQEDFERIMQEDED